ncbi:MAG: rhomboid family intramembrane serine protease [Gammaproteobacteria bacterium]|nr:rhomboid family intramembrane serine protease [Gammaproteobacteria bacterium]
MTYYLDSGLAEIELGAYYRYLNAGDATLNVPQHFIQNPNSYRRMRNDGVFLEKLQAGEIITRADPLYPTWDAQRNHYASLDNQIVAHRFAINPAHPALLTLFTSMFLHADTQHLLGNMLMLLLIGYVVETLLGHAAYLGGYLFAGVMGNVLYVVLSPHVDIPGIGASGAIFGVLGMYVVLFWLRKIRFFIFLFVYFNYFKAPAIIMLFPMLAWQLYIEFGMHTNLNVKAHIGGLLGGTLVALLAKRFLTSLDKAYLDHDITQDRYQQSLLEGQKQLAAMNIKAARRIFSELLRDHPQDLAVKLQLFNILKLTPDSPDFHQLAQQLLNLHGADRRTVKILHDVFVEYLVKAKPTPRLSSELSITLALRFAANDFLTDAEKLVTLLLQENPGFARNAEGLSALAKYYNGKDSSKAQHYRNLLVRTYPDSIEARHLQRA